MDEDDKKTYSINKTEYYPVYRLTEGDKDRYNRDPLSGTIELTLREYKEYKIAHELFEEVQNMIYEKIQGDTDE